MQQKAYNLHMPIMPAWALALNYGFHLLATVLWIGGLATLTLVTWPGLLSAAGDDEISANHAADAIERRFRPVANISLVVLLVTGMLQMGGDPHYQGFLQIADLWSVGLLVKHIIYGGMLLVTAILQLGVQPALSQAQLLARRGSPDGAEQERVLRSRLMWLTRLNLVLGLLVLVLTAVITAL
ncbi:MAG: hypothetical protein Kow00124_12320 [Anaerolineae bacterium]